MLLRTTIALAVGAAMLTPVAAAEKSGGTHGSASTSHRSSGGSHSSSGRSAGTRSTGTKSARTTTHTRSVTRTTSPKTYSKRSVGTVRSHQGSGHHYSHRRHHWHGAWWAYGVGSCWVIDPVYGEYNWVCGDDE